MKLTWLMPLCVATLALGGCVVRQTAMPSGSAAPAYIPPGSALGGPRLPPPVPLTPPGYVPPAAEIEPPADTALTPPPQMGGLTIPPTNPTNVPPADVDTTQAAGWEIAAPAGADAAADTSRRLDEIRAKLSQDRAAAPSMPSRFGGLSASGDVAPSGN